MLLLQISLKAFPANMFPGWESRLAPELEECFAKQLNGRDQDPGASEKIIASDRKSGACLSRPLAQRRAHSIESPRSLLLGICGFLSWPKLAPAEGLQLPGPRLPLQPAPAPCHASPLSPCTAQKLSYLTEMSSALAEHD